MKAKHHFWTSLAAGGALYLATGSSGAFAGAMVGGFLIDADHALDQLWSIYYDAPLMRRRNGDEGANGRGRSLVSRYVRRRKLVRLPLLFHSYELMIALVIVSSFIRTPFLIGLVAGYVLHILLDLIRHYHEFRSPMFYLLSYRLANGFRRDKLIKPEYL